MTCSVEINCLTYAFPAAAGMGGFFFYYFYLIEISDISVLLTPVLFLKVGHVQRKSIVEAVCGLFWILQSTCAGKFWIQQVSHSAVQSKLAEWKVLMGTLQKAPAYRQVQVLTTTSHCQWLPAVLPVVNKQAMLLSQRHPQSQSGRANRQTK